MERAEFSDQNNWKMSAPSIKQYLRKLSTNTKAIIQNELPRFGGSWASAFFLAGLLVPFASPAIGRFRFFLLASLLILMVVQGLGQTYLTAESPEVNSDNLLVILAPMVFVYVVGLFLVLMERITVTYPELRYAVGGAFLLIVSLPLFAAFLPPKPNTVPYPPYWPPIIQDMGRWMKDREVMMSDAPWAIGWYGNRPCVWLTVNYKPDFYEINDFMTPIKALYITRRTFDKPFVAEWFKGREAGWERNFLLQSLTLKVVPTEFPLQSAPSGFWPEQLYLTDSPLRYMRQQR